MENHIIQCKVYRYIHINKLRNRIKVVFFKIEKMKKLPPRTQANVSKYFLVLDLILLRSKWQQKKMRPLFGFVYQANKVSIYLSL